MWINPIMVKQWRKTMMNDFSKKRATAARWMYDRKNRPVVWWRWTVLTPHNNDPEALKFDELTSFQIFADLVHDGLLVPLVASDGHEAYSINPGKEAEWQLVMHPCYYCVRRHIWRIIEISGIIGIAVALLVEKLVGK